MNIIAQLEYELADYDSVVHRFNYYTTRTTPITKDTTTSIKKHANEFKVHAKTVRTGIKNDLSPGSNTPQDTNCTATSPLSRKLFKLDEPDMQDTAGEAEMNS